VSMLCGDSTRVVHPLFQTEDGGSIPTSPLQLHVGRISVDLAIALNAKWHSRLPIVDKSNVIRTKQLACYGAEFGNVWYASAIWTNPVARLLNNRSWMELRRLALAPDAPANSGSRLLRIMVSQIRREYPQVVKVISYQDTDVHLGTIYAAAGWVAAAKSQDGGWDRPNRSRKAAVAPGAKVRWEKDL
jgi:hypothetical protein